MVKARCHSDDFAIDVLFDATEWLEQASDDEIKELAKIGWGGDYQADEVAQFFQENTTERLFDYLSFNPRLMNGDNVGYECHLEENDVLEWLQKNRQELYDTLTEEP